MSLAEQTTGILIKRGATTIAEIVSITPPKFRRNKLETSTHNDGTESNQLGILRQDDASCRINWLADDATHILVLDDILNNTKSEWTILMPSGITMVGQARVQKFEPTDAPVDAVQQADFGLTWAGPIVIS